MGESNMVNLGCMAMEKKCPNHEKIDLNLRKL